ncbi:primosomal protein N', partial [Escherichia coli]
NTLKRTPEKQEGRATLRKGKIWRERDATLEFNGAPVQAVRKKGLCDLAGKPQELSDWRTTSAFSGERLRLNTKQAPAVGAIH